MHTFNYDALTCRLKAGKYKPKPVLRVEIPKEEKGRVRQLGIPVDTHYHGSQ